MSMLHHTMRKIGNSVITRLMVIGGLVMTLLTRHGSLTGKQSRRLLTLKTEKQTVKSVTHAKAQSSLRNSILK